MSGSRYSPIYILDDDDDDLKTAASSTPSASDFQTQSIPQSKKRKRRQFICIDDDNEPVAGPSHVVHEAPSKANIPAREAMSKTKKVKLHHNSPGQGQARLPSQSPSSEIEEITENKSVSSSEWLNYSSDWVNSMAQASEPNTWDLLRPVFPSFVPPVPFVPFAPHNQPQPVLDQAHTRKWQNIIGMPPERDTNGRRSTFLLSSTTTFVSLSGVPYPYTPDPARTLILDQLPKSHRNPTFFTGWGRKVCSAPPVFIAIDSVYAKALVTFATPELAKKAWASPRLSAKSKKGKPREDLIRAWWYCPQDPPISFGSPEPEPEEGEIVDDDKQMRLVNPSSKTDSLQSILPAASTTLETGQPTDHQPGQSDSGGLALAADTQLVPNSGVTSLKTTTIHSPKSSVLPPPPPSLPKRPDVRVFPTRNRAKKDRAAQVEGPATSGSPETEEAKTLAAEQRLRQMVLASKKKQTLVVRAVLASPVESQPADSQPSAVDAPALFHGTPIMRPSESVAVPEVSSSLDQLASSFIAEAIQTVKLPAKASNARLAALDQEIAERNLLLAKLTAATTKQEREQLLVLLRQRDRKATPVLGSSDIRRPVATVSRLRWPVIDSKEGCVLILSDDEDDAATMSE